MKIENGMYDPKELEAQKAAWREADQQAVDSGLLSEEDLCKKNGFFECFDDSKINMSDYVLYDLSRFDNPSEASDHPGTD